MANLSSFQKKSDNAILIGQPLYVLTGNTNIGGTTPDTLLDGSYVRVGSNTVSYDGNYYNFYVKALEIPNKYVLNVLGASPIGFSASAYLNGYYFLGTSYDDATADVVATSTNAINWTQAGAGTNGPVNRFLYNGSVYIMTCYIDKNNLYTSTDRTNWVENQGLQKVNTLQPNDILFDGSLYVAAGDNGSGTGRIATSTNITNWTSRLNTGQIINGLVYNGTNLYLAVGRGSLIRTSTNAINWTTGTGPRTGITYHKAEYLNNTYFVVGEKSTIVSSTDATNWVELKYSATGANLNSIVYNSGMGYYVAGGENFTIYTSTNGTTEWTQKPVTANSPNAVSSMSYVSSTGVLLIADKGKSTVANATYEIVLDSSTLKMPNVTIVKPSINPPSSYVVSSSTISQYIRVK